MDIETLRQWVAQRDSFSTLETVDVFTGERKILKEFDYVIEAPNWTRDGRLVYNSRGRIFTYELTSGEVIGTTRYHDIVASIDRVEIGYTWYAKRWQKSHVNTTCKLLLLTHAFETLGCQVVGLRTDNFNFNSQRAIEGLGAKKDGILRHHQARRDGTVRDSVMYSILLGEWHDVKRHLEFRLARHANI